MKTEESITKTATLYRGPLPNEMPGKAKDIELDVKRLNNLLCRIHAAYEADKEI